VLALGDEIEVMVQEGLAVPPDIFIGIIALDSGLAQPAQHLDTILCPANAIEHGIVIVAFLETREEEVNAALCAHAVGFDSEKVEGVVNLECPLVRGEGPGKVCGGGGVDLDAEDLLWGRRGWRASERCDPGTLFLGGG